MALKSLGKVTVTTGGTPVRATVNESVPAARVPAQSFLVEANPANTGKIYVGALGMSRTTLAGVHGVVGIPTATGTIPSYTASIPLAPAGFNMADFYIDADVNGESALVSLTEQ